MRLSQRPVSAQQVRAAWRWGGDRGRGLGLLGRYGDITPLSVPGKFLVMVMIIISLAFVGCAPPLPPPPASPHATAADWIRSVRR